MRPQRPKIKTISANDAKQRWGSVMSAVEKDGDRIVVASHGKPKVAVVSVGDLERLEALDARERRENALQRLRALEERIGNRNSDLTDQEIEQLADRASREAFDELAAEDKLLFERDQPGQ
jgi:prevent-host-death family protein